MPRHVGDIAASWALQVGNQSHPRLTDTTKTVAGADDTDAGDATELKWEFDEDLGRYYVGRYYVSFPDDQ